MPGDTDNRIDDPTRVTPGRVASGATVDEPTQVTSRAGILSVDELTQVTTTRALAAEVVAAVDAAAAVEAAAVRPARATSVQPAADAALPGDETTKMVVVPKVVEAPGERAVSVREWDRHLRDCLRQEFGPKVTVSGEPLVQGARLAVVRGEDPAFERRARVAKLRVLTVTAADGVVELGPLAVPGEPGCAACARGRRLGAAAATVDERDPDATAVVRERDIPAEAIAVVDQMLRAAVQGDKALVGYVVEVGSGEPLWHKVIPLPDCDLCGGADGIATVGIPEDEDDPEALLQALAGWVDPLTGVIPWVSVSEPLTGGPYVGTAAPPHLVVGGEVRSMPIGWGKGMTRHAAIVSAVGEAIERYSASLPDPDRVVWARAADLDGEVLDPREFPLYEPEQYAARGFPYVAYDRRIDHPWVRGSWLGTDKAVWVPAVFSYLAMGLLPEHLIAQGTSNGLAAGTDADSAAVCATLELVERDAMMCAWLSGAKGRFVELDDTLDIEVADVVEALREAGPAVEVYVLPTSAYGTTAIALAIGDGRRWPAISLGLGSDRSPRAAIRAAVLELAQTAPHLAALLRDGHRAPRHAGEVREMLDHAAFYFPPARMEAFDRLRCGGTSRLADLPEPAFDTSVADLAGHLGTAGIRVAVVDVTSADVATSPFRVVRAVSPDLQPISYGHGVHRAPVSRLRHRGAPIRRLVHPIW
ncbi:YcaO-like family protein [Actinokineospora cianjurensis]|uniref:Ribosomal protein S12 methylthiotransferase accessory factor n=1 Tax=Actinokineospora cianjurensis TaxID=585224 RepID=A0A421B4G8_9PSEU|nr:YcaO-like family protein [Actinokineospora cianjurensis]RLK59332.1 ribosomal protein S12 methylthiotransferase accessory factor [Actinokineospora cianjurensis]